jgi:hypothetical protein
MTELQVSFATETECFMKGQRAYYTTVYRKGWEKDVLGTH